MIDQNIIDVELIRQNPNCNITTVNKFIDKLINKEYYWSYLSYHSNINMCDIENNINLPWDFDAILLNPNLTFSFIEKYYPTLNINDYLYLEQINEEIIKKYETIKNIDYNMLSLNKNLTIKFINDRLDKNWDWSQLSKYINFTEEEFLQYNHLNWSYKDLSINKNLTMKIILHNKDKKFDFIYVSSHDNITMQDIEDNINLPWIWRYVSININININFIRKYLDKSFSWNNLSSHCNITMEDIDNNINLPWNWEYIFSNPNLNEKYFYKFINSDYTKNIDKKIIIKRLFINEFLYNDYTFQKNIEYDIKMRKINIYNILYCFINNNINCNIIKYIYYI